MGSVCRSWPCTYRAIPRSHSEAFTQDRGMSGLATPLHGEWWCCGLASSRAPAQPSHLPALDWIRVIGGHLALGRVASGDGWPWETYDTMRAHGSVGLRRRWDRLCGRGSREAQVKGRPPHLLLGGHAASLEVKALRRGERAPVGLPTPGSSVSTRCPRPTPQHTRRL